MISCMAFSPLVPGNIPASAGRITPVSQQALEHALQSGAICFFDKKNRWRLAVKQKLCRFAMRVSRAIFLESANGAGLLRERHRQFVSGISGCGSGWSRFSHASVEATLFRKIREFA